MRTVLTKSLLLARSLALALALAVPAYAAPKTTPSGLPVPRYVSLKFAEVNARGGPGDDYKLLWVYRARGLPLQVVAETYDWRRVCGPDGSLAWVHRRTVDAHRTVMRTAAQPLALHRGPNPKSLPAAFLAGRAIAGLENCKNGWCRLTAGGVKGWVPQTEVWGLSEAVRCRLPQPSSAR